MKLTVKDFQDAATALGCDVAAIQAVCEVEAPRGGFNPDGTPVTLFEGHKFYKYTDGLFAADVPDLCYQSWTKVHYGKTWQQEQDRLKRAMALDREAALMSASWGKFQIMGFNYKSAGFNSVEDFVDAMHKSEREQLMAFIAFVRNDGAAVYLRSRDWVSFAKKYNGAGYAENQYDKKIAAAYAKFATESVVDSIQESPLKAPSIINMIVSVLKFVFKFFQRGKP